MQVDPAPCLEKDVLNAFRVLHLLYSDHRLELRDRQRLFSAFQQLVELRDNEYSFRRFGISCKDYTNVSAWHWDQKLSVAYRNRARRCSFSCSESEEVKEAPP
jgi:hypothetical protein